MSRTLLKVRGRNGIGQPLQSNHADHEHLLQHRSSSDGQHQHASHHAHMVADFRKRFWVSLLLTIPVLALAPMIQELLGLREILAFPGDAFLQAALASVIY